MNARYWLRLEPMTEENKSQEFTCRECQAGMMRLKSITYFTWLGDELVTVPGFPAWVCDVCGHCEYDQRALSWLVTMLNPEAGRKTTPRPRVHARIDKRDSTRPVTK